jgi:hypothetical protein
MGGESGYPVLVGELAGFWLIYWGYVAFGSRTREQIRADLREAPWLAACAWLTMIGTVFFLLDVLSLGRFGFEIPLPWGELRTKWVSLALALLGTPLFFTERYKGKVS